MITKWSGTDCASPSVSSATSRWSARRTGDEAIRMAREKRPDVVLLDAKIEDMDGPEVCRKLLIRDQGHRAGRAEEGHPGCPSGTLRPRPEGHDARDHDGGTA